LFTRKSSQSLLEIGSYHIRHQYAPFPKFNAGNTTTALSSPSMSISGAKKRSSGASDSAERRSTRRFVCSFSPLRTYPSCPPAVQFFLIPVPLQAFLMSFYPSPHRATPFSGLCGCGPWLLSIRSPRWHYCRTNRTNLLRRLQEKMSVIR